MFFYKLDFRGSTAVHLYSYLAVYRCVHGIHHYMLLDMDLFLCTANQISKPDTLARIGILLHSGGNLCLCYYFVTHLLHLLSGCCKSMNKMVFKTILHNLITKYINVETDDLQIFGLLNTVAYGAGAFFLMSDWKDWKSQNAGMPGQGPGI